MEFISEYLVIWVYQCGHGANWRYGMEGYWLLNSLSPERYSDSPKCLIFHYILVIDILIISNANTHKWTPHGVTDDKLLLSQVMAWFRRVTTHLLNRCGPVSWPEGSNYLPFEYIYRILYINWSILDNGIHMIFFQSIANFVFSVLKYGTWSSFDIQLRWGVLS